MTSESPSLYSPSPDELAFFTSQTGITDQYALKDHIFAVQAKALKVAPFTTPDLSSDCNFLRYTLTLA
jgi:hypothetical protein